MVFLSSLTIAALVGVCFEWSNGILGDEMAHLKLTSDIGHGKLEAAIEYVANRVYWSGAATRLDWSTSWPREPALTIAEGTIVITILGLVLWRKLRK